MDISYNGTGTLTGAALDFAMKHKFSPETGRRPDKPHLTVVLTDGRSLDDVRGEVIESLHHDRFCS